jgi:AhpD family alkylhydroperoxidase
MPAPSLWQRYWTRNPRSNSRTTKPEDSTRRMSNPSASAVCRRTENWPLNSLVRLFQNVHGGSFTEAQVQIVLLTDAVTNACTWAVAFHTALARRLANAPTGARFPSNEL